MVTNKVVVLNQHGGRRNPPPHTHTHHSRGHLEMSRDTLNCRHQQKLLQTHGIRRLWIQDAEQSPGGPVTVAHLFKSLSGVTVEKTCLKEKEQSSSGSSSLVTRTIVKRREGWWLILMAACQDLELPQPSFWVCVGGGAAPTGWGPSLHEEEKASSTSMRQHVYFLTVDAIQPAAALPVLLRWTVAPLTTSWNKHFSPGLLSVKSQLARV